MFWKCLLLQHCFIAFCKESSQDKQNGKQNIIMQRKTIIVCFHTIYISLKSKKNSRNTTRRVYIYSKNGTELFWTTQLFLLEECLTLIIVTRCVSQVICSLLSTVQQGTYIFIVTLWIGKKLNIPKKFSMSQKIREFDQNVRFSTK